MISRRTLLRLGLGAALAPRGLRAAPRGWPSNPFHLGVAAGYPRPDGAVLWTRLAPSADADSDVLDSPDLTLRFEVAEDVGFKRILRQGEATAEAAFAHSVHLEVDGLAPRRWYHYRFHSADATSAVGRFRTAPAADDAVADGMRFAVAACQHWETGHYAAYRHMLADEPDLVLHLGDYIYENDTPGPAVRRHRGAEPVTLADYRRRYAQYRSDPDLQAAHAACAWAAVWDDHEVQNDYVGDRALDLADPVGFRARRLAAYRAWYEHLPVPATMRPVGETMRIHTALDFGRLARFVLVDGRQYRDPQPCPPAGRGGSATIRDCAARTDPARSFLGAAQEAWFDAEWRRGDARWNLLGQQSPMAQADSADGSDEAFYSDAWDGYPAARRRLLESVVASGRPNPVVLSGDIHSYWVSDLKTDYASAEAPTVATEFVTTAISSKPIPEALAAALLANNPHLRFGRAGPRGYLRVECRPERLAVDLRALDDVTRPDSACRTLASFIVADGRAGAERA